VRLVLASGSPRRKELLGSAGFTFEVMAADIDESERVGEDAASYVKRLAEEKARVVAARVPDAVVLGADTTVVIDGEILQKPVDAVDAERMLRKLSGRTHQVHTGVAVVRGGVCLSHVDTTDVVFRVIAEDELKHYVASGHAMDKAGAYGIQGYAARWIPRIDGDYFNVVGLPLSAVVGMLGEAGVRD
jgi:septum formation protein